MSVLYTVQELGTKNIDTLSSAFVPPETDDCIWPRTIFPVVRPSNVREIEREFSLFFSSFASFAGTLVATFFSGAMTFRAR